MAVARITPSQTYRQDETSRIQINLANAIDALAKNEFMLADMGTFWTGSSSPVMPTAYAPLMRLVYPNNGIGNNGIATMQAVVNPGFTGHVVALNGWVNGSIGSGNTVQMQAMKNANVFGSPIVLNVTTGGAFTQQALNVNATFKATDYLSVYIRGSVSTINQSFSATLLLAKDV